MHNVSISPAECAEKIRKADTIVVLSGAGMSTAAGVPDFRGPDGLYVTRAYDPEKVFDIGWFDRDPEPFYEFSRDFLATLDSLEPTFTHRFLARLEADGKNVAIITQNIDGLHQRAGSQRVYPMHGDYETAHCRKCGQFVAGADILDAVRGGAVPACPQCGGVVKPDVVFFGESVRHLDKAWSLAEMSDLLLVLGSSLTVYPAAAIPSRAGGDVVVVNRGPVGMRAGRGVWFADCDLDGFFKDVAAERIP